MPKLIAPAIAAGQMTSSQQPVLDAGGLLLRPWESADAPTLVAAYSDPAIQRWHLQSLTAAEADDYVSAANAGWAAETSANWAVTDADDVVGRVSVRSIDLTEGLAVIAYWVLPAGRGRGVAVRALRAASTWALVDLGLHRLELEHSTANEGSCRVATKAGYTLEGTKRSQARHSDGWHDMHLHALLAGDLANPNPAAAHIDPIR